MLYGYGVVKNETYFSDVFVKEERDKKKKFPSNMSFFNNVMRLASEVCCKRSHTYCCDRYNHAAVFFAHSKSLYVPMSYGENHYDANSTCSTNHTIHAEENAMRKLPPIPRNKKPKKVDLLVIRVNKTNMGNSKPCIHCILKMRDLPNSKGYTIQRVFFSTNTGAIVGCKLVDLIQEDSHHVSSFYRGTGFNFR